MRVVKLIFLLVIFMTIWGCNDNSALIKNHQEAEGAATDTVDNNATDNTATDAGAQSEENNFFGVWEFSKTLPGYISGLSQEEADAYIGKQFVYSQLYCEYEGQILDPPHYKYEQVPTSEFIEGYKLSNEDWDIQEEYITRVEVYQDEAQTERWGERVSSFYIIGSHLIINIEGEFFELNRITSNKLKRTIVTPTTLEIGQSMGELTVAKLDTSGTGEDLQINDITFSGELTLTGTYEWEDTGDGYGYIITLDEEMMDRIPLFEDFADERTLILSNTEEAKKLLSSSSGKATFVITNYSIGYRQIMISADLVEVREWE